MLFGKFREDLSVVFQRDPAARNYFEILTDSLDTKIIPLFGFAFGVELSQLVVVLAILIVNTILIKLKIIN